MEALELLKIIRDNLDVNSKIELTSPTMYDKDHLERKVSFSVFEKNDVGVYKRFNVVIEDIFKPKL